MKQVEVASTSIKTEYFGSLTERMNKYREDVLNKKPYIDAERAVLATRHMIVIRNNQMYLNVPIC